MVRVYDWDPAIEGWQIVTPIEHAAAIGQILEFGLCSEALCTIGWCGAALVRRAS